MKKLIFVRHGRAEDLSPELTDFERSLTSRGKIISKLMARRLMVMEKSLGLIITSPAFRAVETALIFAGEFGTGHDNFIINRNLYYKMSFSNFDEILSLIKADADTVTLFGHNPSFSEITNCLCRTGCDFIPKSGVVGITFDREMWPEIRRKTGNMEYFLKPENSL
jgi:phosphohistidine phosphatase